MDCTAFSQPFSALSPQQREQLRNDCALLSLSQAFASLPDPRSRHGWRYDLAFLLTCLVAALLCNYNHSEAAGQWCRGQRATLARLFGPRRYLSPTGALYRWLLPQLSISALETLLSCWVRATLDPRAPISHRIGWQRSSWSPQPLSSRLPICFPFGAILIYRSPQIMFLASDRKENFVHMPRVPTAKATTTQFIRVGLPKRQTPLPNRFIGDDDPALGQKLFHVTKAERERKR